jgi:PAS domain S-box-containing protein
MGARNSFSLGKTDFFWGAVSLLVLLPCIYYTYVHLQASPDFTLNPNDWRVLYATTCPDPDPDSCLQVGDQVLAIGQFELQEFINDRTIELRDGFTDGVAQFRVLRDGRVLTLPVRMHTKRGGLPRLPPTLLFPLIFWLMGTTAVLFLRPRDEGWLVLILFSYVTALWFASGLASSLRTGGAGIVFHVLIWLFLPLSVHLHLILPSPLLRPKTRSALLMPLYAFTGLVIVLDFFYLLGPWTFAYVWTSLIAILASLGLLLLRLFLRLAPAGKVAARIMLYGIVLGLGPTILLFGVIPPVLTALSLISDFNPLYPLFLGTSLVSMPILPMSYIYAIYKHHIGAMEFRANRLLGVYSFAAVSITSYVVVLFLVSSQWIPINEGFLAAVITTSAVFVTGAFLLRSRFQSLVDRHVFGVKHSTEEVIGIVSERIPKAFDRAVLAQVIADEILPTLLIRQSALYLFEESGLEALYEQGVPRDEPSPTPVELHWMLENSGRYLHPAPGAPGDNGARSWVRVVIPLSVQDETIGAWLIGRRDPDDFYPSTDIQLISTVANQIAPMVENIRLYERAQQEIAQRKTAEEEIRRSEERFRNLFEATFEGIAIVRAGVILEVNHALLSIFGFAAGELIGRNLSDLVSASGEIGSSGVPRECIGFKRDGTGVEVEAVGKKYVFQGEDVIVVAIRDITQRKRDEAERKMLQRQLLVSQKMEAIGRLSAGVAHDFNNCLLAIFGYSDLLLDRYQEDVFLGRNLSGIKEAGQKAAALTKQLLAFARRQPLETRVMDLNEVVSGVEKMLGRLLGEDITLETDLTPDPGKVKIDPGQIEHVIVNLAVNARHAMPGGGRLTIRTAALSVRGGSAPRADLSEGAWVLLTVADTGTGMDAETQARVFEPFFTTKTEGTGLGLSSAYGIVRQSGGHIFVDSAPGQGACFSIYLPVTQEKEGRRIGTTLGGADLGTETILLVEDEDKVRAVLQQILANKGYRVLAAQSGEEALALARRHEGTIHLVLTDVTMPQMKGPELAARLLAERPRTRVIYMSGYNEEQLPETGRICLQKPFVAPVLTHTVRAVLDSPEETDWPEAVPA